MRLSSQAAGQAPPNNKTCVLLSEHRGRGLFGCLVVCGEDLPAVVEQLPFIPGLLKKGQQLVPQGSIRRWRRGFLLPGGQVPLPLVEESAEPGPVNCLTFQVAADRRQLLLPLPKRQGRRDLALYPGLFPHLLRGGKSGPLFGLLFGLGRQGRRGRRPGVGRGRGGALQPGRGLARHRLGPVLRCDGAIITDRTLLRRSRLLYRSGRGRGRGLSAARSPAAGGAADSSCTVATGGAGSLSIR